MKYTDKELIRASQIAYFTINNDVIREAQSTSYTLLELLNCSSTFSDNIYDNISKTAGFTVTKDSDPEEVLRYIESDTKRQMVAEKFAIIHNIKNGEIDSWKVVSYVDNNAIGVDGTAGKLVDGTWDHQNFSSSGDGLAAMVFETGTVKNYT